MMESIKIFIESCLTREDIEGKHVLDVGSMDVNGSSKTMIMMLNPKSYLGVDKRYGKNVDLVWDAEDLDKLPIGPFDLVICTDTLEHILNWRKAVNNMKALTKVGGKLLITTVSKGFPMHDYPEDYWRFELEDFTEIFSEFDNTLFLLNPQLPGVFFRGTKTDKPPVDISTMSIAGLEYSFHIDERFIL